MDSYLVLYVPTLGKEHGWSELGRRYLQACLDADLPVRAQSTSGPVDFMGDDSPWKPYREAFSHQAAPQHLMVVVGVPDTLKKYWVEGLPAIAITAWQPNYGEPEREAIRLYGITHTPTEATAEALTKALGVETWAMGPAAAGAYFHNMVVKLTPYVSELRARIAQYQARLLAAQKELIG